jgi:glyoxylase I family protein
MATTISGVCPLLQVFDMPSSVRFYRDVLGFEVVSHSPLIHGRQGEYFHWAMLRVDDVMVMLNTAYDEGVRPLAPDAARVAAHADTALFFSCPDVDTAYARVCSLGAKVEESPTITNYGMKRFIISDPDGYSLCFQAATTSN